jgi:hypothetical protein
MFDLTQYGKKDLERIERYLDGLFFYGIDNASLRQAIKAELKKREVNNNEQINP